MSEKLHIPSHRYGNKKYSEGWDRTFKNKKENGNKRPNTS